MMEEENMTLLEHSEITSDNDKLPWSDCMLGCPVDEKQQVYLFPCLHVLCSDECWEIFKTQNESEEDMMACSLCNCVILEENLPDKVVLNDIFKNSKEDSGETDVNLICEHCVFDRAAIVYCDSCGYCLCDDCAKIHPTTRLTSGHVLKTDLTSIIQKTKGNSKAANAINCAEHEQQTKSYYCVDCEVKLCRGCCPPHKGHDVAYLARQKQILMERVESTCTLMEQCDTVINEIYKKREQILKTSYANIMAEMKNEFTSLIAALYKRHHEISSEIRLEYAERVASLNGKRKNASNAKAQGIRFVLVARELFNHRDDIAAYNFLRLTDGFDSWINQLNDMLVTDYENYIERDWNFELDNAGVGIVIESLKEYVKLEYCHAEKRPLKEIQNDVSRGKIICSPSINNVFSEMGHTTKFTDVLEDYATTNSSSSRPLESMDMELILQPKHTIDITSEPLSPLLEISPSTSPFCSPVQIPSPVLISSPVPVQMISYSPQHTPPSSPEQSPPPSPGQPEHTSPAHNSPPSPEQTILSSPEESPPSSPVQTPPYSPIETPCSPVRTLCLSPNQNPSSPVEILSTARVQNSFKAIRTRNANGVASKPNSSTARTINGVSCKVSLEPMPKSLIESTLNPPICPSKPAITTPRSVSPDIISFSANSSEMVHMPFVKIQPIAMKRTGGVPPTINGSINNGLSRRPKAVNGGNHDPSEINSENYEIDPLLNGISLPIVKERQKRKSAHLNYETLDDDNFEIEYNGKTIHERTIMSKGASDNESENEITDDNSDEEFSVDGCGPKSGLFDNTSVLSNSLPPSPGQLEINPLVNPPELAVTNPDSACSSSDEQEPSSRKSSASGESTPSTKSTLSVGTIPSIPTSISPIISESSSSESEPNVATSKVGSLKRKKPKVVPGQKICANESKISEIASNTSPSPRKPASNLRQKTFSDESEPKATSSNAGKLTITEVAPATELVVFAKKSKPVSVVIQPTLRNSFSPARQYSHKKYTIIVSKEPPNPIIVNKEPPNPFVASEEPPNPSFVNKEPPNSFVDSEEPPNPIFISEEPPNPIVISDEMPNPIFVIEESPNLIVSRDEPPNPIVISDEPPNPFVVSEEPSTPIVISESEELSNSTVASEEHSNVQLFLATEVLEFMAQNSVATKSKEAPKVKRRPSPTSSPSSMGKRDRKKKSFPDFIHIDSDEEVERKVLAEGKTPPSPPRRRSVRPATKKSCEVDYERIYGTVPDSDSDSDSMEAPNTQFTPTRPPSRNRNDGPPPTKRLRTTPEIGFDAYEEAPESSIDAFQDWMQYPISKTTQMKFAETGEDDNEDYCTICLDGGEDLIVCCDSCPRVFHTKCHIPPIETDLNEEDNWICNYETTWDNLQQSIKDLPEDDGEGGEIVKSNRKQFDIACKFLMECFKIPQIPTVRHIFPQAYKDAYGKVPFSIKYIQNRLCFSNPTSFSSVIEYLLAFKQMFNQARRYYTANTQYIKPASACFQNFLSLVSQYYPTHTDLFNDVEDF